jgi:hypothetical protein
MKKVRITKRPEMRDGGATKMFGAQTPPVDNTVSPGPGSFHGGNDPEIKINRTLKPTTKENATLEAEVGETIVTNLSGDGIPEFYKVGGKRHYKGGTPLNVPENSFIFSRDKSMKINDPELLKMFGKSGKSKKSYTPAELSMSYDLNKYKEILANPSSSKRDIETAEQMIKNYNLKLGALALVQESVKGFDNGIPNIAMPYLQSVGIDPAQLVNPQMAPTPEQMQTAMYGKEFKSKSSSMPAFKQGGELRKYQKAGEPKGKKYKRYDLPNGKTFYLPEGATMEDVKSKKISAVLPKDVKLGDIITYDNEDGKSVTQKVSKINIEGFTGNVSDYVAESELSGDRAEAYARLAQRLKTDDNLREKLVTQYKENIKNAVTKRPGILSAEDIQKAAAMEEDDIINTILKAEKQFLVLEEKGLDYTDENADVWQGTGVGFTGEEGSKHPAGYINATKQAGLTPLTNVESLVFQTGINSIRALQNDEDPSVAGFSTAALGYQNKLSPEDGLIGGMTSKSYAMLADPKYKFDLADIEQPAEEPGVELSPQEGPERLPWHTQDLINLRGAQGDLFSINKYRPFRPGIGFDTPEFAGVDFRGAAGTLASGMAGAANQLGQFAGPQAYNARMADVQAKGAEGVAKLREQEYATNQGMLNQFNTNVAQMRNANAIRQAQADKKFSDENAIANQQFDNSKRMAKANIRNAMIQGITNVEKTGLYNEMYDDFNIRTQAFGPFSEAGVKRNDTEENIKPGSKDIYNDPAEFARVQREAFGTDISGDEIMKQYYNQNRPSSKNNKNMYPPMYPNYNFGVNPAMYNQGMYNPRMMRGYKNGGEFKEK